MHNFGKARGIKIASGSKMLRLNYVSITIFFVFCILGGGASRNDALSQPLIWLASIFCVVTCLFVIQREDWENIKAPIIFTSLCALLACIHLVPLPPALWAALPGRGAYADLADIAGIDAPWRPLSITPDFTWSSLLSLLPPNAVILAFATMGERFRRFLPVGLLCVCVGSAILGLAQLGSGDGGPLRFYEVANKDFAIGLFANRNHQALLLALGIPLIIVVARLSQNAHILKFAPWINLATILFLVPMILVTGARIGVVLGVYALLISVVLARTILSSRYTPKQQAMPSKANPYIAPLAVLGIVAFTLMFARAVAIERIFASDPEQELRFKIIEPLISIAQKFFPFGSGFGSFEPIFRQYEPFDLLRPSYMNHAHNDLLQLAIEGGMPALLLAAGLVIWLVFANIRLWRAPSASVGRSLMLGRYAAAMVPIIFAASLFDYPLRTPLMGVIFTILLLWIHDALRDRRLLESKRANT